MNRATQRGRDFPDVNGLLRSIELAGHHHMRGGEVPDGFRIFDNPDGVILVCHKDGPLGFPFRVPDRGTSTPAFLHAIRAARLRVLGPASLIADPTGPRGVLLLRGE